MREMKDSGVKWIGKIPAGWSVIKFKYTHNGSNVGEGIDKDFWSNSEDDKIFYTAQVQPIRTNYADFPSWKYTSSRDLLLARNGTPYVHLPVDGAIYTDHIIRVTILDDYDRKFIRYCLQNSIITEFIEAVSIPTWSAYIWNRQILPLPPLTEQIAIASYLDDKCTQIDAIISRHELIIAKLKEYRASLITETVTRGLNPDPELKDSGVKLKYLCTCNDENLAESTSDDYEFDYIDIGSVTQSEGVSMLQRMSFKNAPSRARRIVRNGDVIISTVRTYLKAVARINFSNVPQIASTGFAVLRAKNINPNYLYYAVISDSFVSSVEAKSVGISYPAINSSELMNLKIPVPPLDQQAAIASYLDDKCARIDDNIAKRELIIRKLTDYKKSLIYEAVTGKKEYNHHENDME